MSAFVPFPTQEHLFSGTPPTPIPFQHQNCPQFTTSLLTTCSYTSNNLTSCILNAGAETLDSADSSVFSVRPVLQSIRTPPAQNQSVPSSPTALCQKKHHHVAIAPPPRSCLQTTAHFDVAQSVGFDMDVAAPEDNIALTIPWTIRPQKMFHDTTTSTITTTNTNHLQVSRHCEQINSKEDMVPQYLRSGSRLIFMVADGHSGRQCVDTLSANMDRIFELGLSTDLHSAMALCVNLCSTFRSGAMVVLSIYDASNRILETISVGDSSLSVYIENNTNMEPNHSNSNNARLFHTQPHHSPSEVQGSNACAAKIDEMKSKGIQCKVLRDRNGRLRAAPPVPDRDGKTFHWNQAIPAYAFVFPGDEVQRCSVASSSFVGHYGCVTMSPNYTSITIPTDCKFHIVSGSDGISDVMSPFDPEFLRCSEGGILPALTAKRVVEVAKQRWFGEMLLNKDDGTPVSTITYAPSPSYADDISCLVVHGC